MRQSEPELQWKTPPSSTWLRPTYCSFCSDRENVSAEKRRERDFRDFTASSPFRVWSLLCCCCCSLTRYFLLDRSCGTFYWEEKCTWTVTTSKARRRGVSSYYHETNCEMSLLFGWGGCRSKIPDTLVTQNIEYYYAKNNLSQSHPWHGWLNIGPWGPMHHGPLTPTAHHSK